MALLLQRHKSVTWLRTEAVPLLRMRLRLLLWPSVAALLFIYFAWHAVQGDRGLLAFAQMQNQLYQQQQELAQLEAERVRLSDRVEKMRPETLDADLLEERVRAVLGQANADELIVLQPQPVKTP